MANSRSGDSMLDRFVRILTAFDASRRSMSVATLARRADVPLATAYRLVEDMVCRDLLTRSGDGQISLGLRLWELANRSSPARDLREGAMPFMEDIQAVVRQHTQLAVLSDDEVLVIERLSSPGSVVNPASIAGRLPVHRTSSGVVLLAFAPNHVQEAYLARHPEAGVGLDAAPYDFRQLLARVRQQGFAALDGLVDAETSGVAVPVIGHGNSAIAALSVVVPLLGDRLHAIIPVLMTGARGISRAMGTVPGGSVGVFPLNENSGTGAASAASH
ncbi:MAG: IclR family transcriptional regulator [Actinomycetota bacterium]|nr:IclR family transcriptional regulator [Actinomycetota bacterium]